MQIQRKKIWKILYKKSDIVSDHRIRYRIFTVDFPTKDIIYAHIGSGGGYAWAGMETCNMDHHTTDIWR